MTKDEYNEGLKKIHDEYKLAQSKWNHKFAMSKVKFGIGDIIQEADCIILVDKIRAYIGFGDPQPVYEGFELKKDFTPKKNGRRESIFGDRDIQLIKRAVQKQETTTN